MAERVDDNIVFGGKVKKNIINKMEEKKEPTHGLEFKLVWKRMASASSHCSHQSLCSTGLLFLPFEEGMTTPSAFGNGGKVSSGNGQEGKEVAEANVNRI